MLVNSREHVGISDFDVNNNEYVYDVKISLDSNVDLNVEVVDVPKADASAHYADHVELMNMIRTR